MRSTIAATAFLLADDARGEEIADHFQIELPPGIEDRYRQSGKLRQRLQYLMRGDRLLLLGAYRGELEHQQGRAGQSVGAEVLSRGVERDLGAIRVEADLGLCSDGRHHLAREDEGFGWR
jgi:hypothetical protein